LAVLGGLEPNVELTLSFDARDRDEKAPVELAAVDGDEVDLGRRVCAGHIPAGCQPASSHPNDHNVPARAQPPPLHLHSPETIGDVECQIDAPVLSNGR
jgi:hypothetical protein